MKRPRRKGIWILIAAVVLAAATFAVSLLLGGRANPISAALGVITTPVRSGLSSLAGWMEDRYNYSFRYDELAAENEALKQRIAELEEAARTGQDAIEENERLRDLLGLRARRTDLTLEDAKVTARGASNWTSTLTLSKGTNYGINPGNCVVDQYGNLVGIVSETAYNWSTVITVVDTDLEMGALVARTDSPAILEGDFSLMGQGKLKLTYLPENTQFLSGDQVLTSGMGGVYPSGLVVGTMDEILADPTGMGRYAVITPAADLDDLRQVFVITDFDIVE